MADEQPTKEQTPVQGETVAVPPAKKSGNKTLMIVLVVVFVIFVLPAIVFGVGFKLLLNKAGDKVAEKGVESALSAATGGKVDVNSNDGSFSVSSKDGDSSISVGSNQKLPDGFPKSDIPYITEKAVTFSMNSTNDGKKEWSTTTTISKSFEEAKTYFAGVVKEPDYTNITTYGYGNTQTYYGKGSKYTVSITVSKNTDDNTVLVSYIVTEN